MIIEYGYARNLLIRGDDVPVWLEKTVSGSSGRLDQSYEAFKENTGLICPRPQRIPMKEFKWQADPKCEHCLQAQLLAFCIVWIVRRRLNQGVVRLKFHDIDELDWDPPLRANY